VLSGSAAGASLPIARANGATIQLINTSDPVAAGGIRAGDAVRIDISWALALQTYQRHQVPPEPGYYGWDQFRDGDGKPIYPQRPVLIGPTGTANAAGSVLSGAINGKVLVLAALLDIDAYPWQADWYRSRVRDSLGADFADSFALWFIDNAHHENPMTPLARTHAVSYGGALQQALRDLAHWVEEGVRPAETAYRVIDSQVVVPDSAAERGGVQPVVALRPVSSEVRVGQPVTLTAAIEVPPGAGQVVAAEWDFDGSGEFASPASIGVPAELVELEMRHAFATPGTHFVALRVTAQREGDAATPYGRVQNIARARVEVA
jgi:hypothetical protein